MGGLFEKNKKLNCCPRFLRHVFCYGKVSPREVRPGLSHHDRLVLGNSLCSSPPKFTFPSLENSGKAQQQLAVILNTPPKNVGFLITCTYVHNRRWRCTYANSPAHLHNNADNL